MPGVSSKRWPILDDLLHTASAVVLYHGSGVGAGAGRK